MNFGRSFRSIDPNRPLGSGRRLQADLRALPTPQTQADRPVGEWNRFEITVRGDSARVVLNDRVVIPGVWLPGLPTRGPIGLQHHGENQAGRWVGPPSLIQYRNVFIRPLDE